MSRHSQGPAQALHLAPGHGSRLCSWFPLHGSVDLLESCVMLGVGSWTLGLHEDHFNKASV